MTKTDGLFYLSLYIYKSTMQTKVDSKKKYFERNFCYIYSPGSDFGKEHTPTSRAVSKRRNTSHSVRSLKV